MWSSKSYVMGAVLSSKVVMWLALAGYIMTLQNKISQLETNSCLGRDVVNSNPSWGWSNAPAKGTWRLASVGVRRDWAALFIRPSVWECWILLISESHITPCLCEQNWRFHSGINKQFWTVKVVVLLDWSGGQTARVHFLVALVIAMTQIWERYVICWSQQQLQRKEWGGLHFCRLDFLYLLQTPMAYTTQSSTVYILPKTVLTSRTLQVASSVTCLGLQLDSKILWEPDLRWMHVKCRHSLNIYVRHSSHYTLYW
jgi:hypothetical protein